MSRFYRGAVVALVLLTLGACGKEEGYTTFTVPTGFLRTVNLMPDSPSLNVSLNGELRQRQSFSGSSSFLQVLPLLDLTLNVDYNLGDQIIDVITGESVFIGVNHQMTLFFAGPLASPVLIKLDNPPQDATTDTTKLELQFVHAATGAGPVVVTLQQASVVTQHNLDFADFTPLVVTDPGDYSIVVTAAGTGNLLWESGPFTLSAGTRGTIALIDYFGPGGNGVRAVTLSELGIATFANEQLPAFLRVANMTSDQGPLDVYLDGDLISTGLPFGQIDAYLDVPSPIESLVVTPAGDPGTVLSDAENLVPSFGSFQTLTVTGAGATHVSQIHFDDTRPISTRARITATNAAVGRGNFDVYILAPGTSVASVGPSLSSLTAIPSATSSQVITLDAGSYDLSITAFATTDVLVGPLRIDVVDEGIYSFFVTNPAGGGDGPLEIVRADDFN